MKVLGWPKGSIGFSYEMLKKNPNEAFGQPHIRSPEEKISKRGHFVKDCFTWWDVGDSWQSGLSELRHAAAAKSRQSCPTLCDPIDGSPPGSPVPGILQARTLEWVAISFSNAWKWKVKVKSLSCVRLLATPWTVAYQPPPSMGFPRQEYWSRVPLPSPLGHGVSINLDKGEKRESEENTWTPYVNGFNGKQEGNENISESPGTSVWFHDHLNRLLFPMTFFWVHVFEKKKKTLKLCDIKHPLLCGMLGMVAEDSQTSGWLN